MKERIVFATNNAHKLKEIREILDSRYEVLSLNDIGCHDEIPEDYETLEENSREKAEYIFRKYGMSCFADDTGLEVDALGGAPGVYSARYAGGAGHDSEANIQKLLRELGDNPNRKARFRTVITLILRPDDEAQEPLVKTFEGIVEGRIDYGKTGTGDFGYDPIFIPEGHDQSFAAMSSEAKNAISHRGRAVEKLYSYLNQ